MNYLITPITCFILFVNSRALKFLYYFRVCVGINFPGPTSLLPLLDHVPHPYYKSPTTVFVMYHLVLTCGISFLLRSVNLILFTVLLESGRC